KVCLKQLGVHSERRRHLGSVQESEPARSACTKIMDGPTTIELTARTLNRCFKRIDLTQCNGNAVMVLSEELFEYLPHWPGINSHGCWITHLSVALREGFPH